MVKINLRESIDKLDRETFCKDDLLNMYYSCNFSDKDKVKLVEMFSRGNKKSAAKFIKEAFEKKYNGVQMICNPSPADFNASMGEGIEDDLSNEEPETILDLLEKSTYVIVTNDNVENVDTGEIARDILSDELDDDFKECYNEDYENNKFIVSKDEVDKILRNLQSLRLYFSDYKKTKEFMDEYSLDYDDLRSIVSQLRAEDYSYSIESKNPYFLGNVLHIFITGKDFVISGDRTISGIDIYIKIDATELGYMSVVSIHPAKYREDNPYEDTDDNFVDLTNKILPEGVNDLEHRIITTSNGKKFSANIKNSGSIDFTADVEMIHPYDDAHYIWARIEANKRVYFIRNGIVLELTDTYRDSFWPDDYETTNEYINDFLYDVAEDLVEMNSDTEERIDRS